MLASLDLPSELAATGERFVARRAVADDLPSLVALLADDAISARRGDTAAARALDDYRSALIELIADPANEIVLIEDDRGAPVATMQLTRIPGMARRGATRLQIEAVRVGSAHRSRGVGAAMMRWAVGPAATATGASLVQLTSDDSRGEAHRFYERMGFVASHRGFKFSVR